MAVDPFRTNGGTSISSEAMPVISAVHPLPSGPEVRMSKAA